MPFVGFAESQILGSQPNLALGHEDSVKTPFRPDAPCENQQPPNLETSNGPAPQQVAPSQLRCRSRALASKRVEPAVDLPGIRQLRKSYAQAQQLSRGQGDQGDTLMGEAMNAVARGEGASPTRSSGRNSTQKSQGSSK